MGLINLFKSSTKKEKSKTSFYSKPTESKHTSNNNTYTQVKTTSAPNGSAMKYDYPIADFQWNFVKDEVDRLNDLLKTLEYTKELHMNSNALTNDSYFRYEPFTPKTGKISKYPCMLHACSTVYMGYSVSIYYDVKDIPCKGSMHIATPNLTYTIDFKNIDGTLQITKVITTDKNLDNEKLYHIMANGEVYKK